MLSPHYRIVLWLLIISNLTFGCSKKPSTSEVDMPDIGIPLNELNTKVRLAAPRGWNTFKIGHIIAINVDVISSEQVEFTFDYGARIFIWKDNQWSEVPNSMGYPEGDIILPITGNGPFTSGSTSVVPVISNVNEPVTVRIFVIGYIYKNGQITDKRTGAYIDVKVYPP